MPGDAVTAVGTARLYGKLPAHGDFVSRGFSRAEAEACDAWLSASLADAHAAHGAGFAARYDGALPWRYAGAGRQGALTPSQDAAGRRFPLYLDVKTGLAAKVEELLYRAIAERWTADALIAAAEALSDEAEPTDGERWWLDGGDAALSGSCPPDLLTRMLAVEVPA